MDSQYRFKKNYIKTHENIFHSHQDIFNMQCKHRNNIY